MVRKTMVDVFKQLIHSESHDVFESVITNHYKKFRYFYNTITALDMPASTQFTPSYTDTALYIEIKLDKTVKAADYESTILSTIESLVCVEKELFEYSVSSTGVSSLNISIVNKSITREDEMYENLVNHN